MRETPPCFCCCYRSWAVLSPSPFWPAVQLFCVRRVDPLRFDSQPPGFLTLADPFWTKTASQPRPLPPFILLQIVTSASRSPCDYWHPGPFLPSKNYCSDSAQGFLEFVTLLFHSAFQPPKAEYCSFYAIIHNSDTQGVMLGLGIEPWLGVGIQVQKWFDIWL